MTNNSDGSLFLYTIRKYRQEVMKCRQQGLAFQGFEQRGLFAALIGTRAGMRVQVKVPTRPEDILAENAALIGFRNRTVFRRGRPKH